MAVLLSSEYCSAALPPTGKPGTQTRHLAYSIGARLTGSNFWQWDLDLKIPAREGMTLEFRPRSCSTSWNAPTSEARHYLHKGMVWHHSRRYQRQFALTFHVLMTAG